ncbi:FAD-binding oxidoreductase [Amycolatopsis rubida]|uniref:FAD-binding oxidoreductase n=2 Tax=Amycolatopsis TaxID=1813 RepID=A0ABX0C166_9PSEU|nr:FAD-binding oxidoreductase [Amycolatopsis rubida]MYW96083.1 FAD-binding protein [Amycolatopsis rubida]NEC61074.1 FAD-binding oxidoreductase [Amycolatopsis rubida]OAP23406.1 putative FAD-linked oxidoreductase [Amycolatopsis sp. M39]
MAGRHPHRADAVVALSSFDEASGVFRIAAEHRIPVTVRALGSSVTGQPLPVDGGIVLDVSKIPAEHRIDERDMTVTASASFNGGVLEDLLAERGYTTGHSPQSLYRSTVGGWIATLATGQFSSMYGGIEDLVTGYTVVLATGETVRVEARPRAAMGPDLRQVFLGSEGTLGLVTSVTLKIFPRDLPTRLQTFALPTVEAGLELMREQALQGLSPYLLRFYDTDEARHALKDPSVGTPVLFAGTRGPEDVARAEMQVLERLAAARGGRLLGPAGAEAWMGRRFDFSTVENLLGEPGGYAETIEVAHTWSGIGGLYQALKESLAPLADEVLAHFSHVYTQGTSMYVILLGRAETDAAAVDRLRQIWDTAMAVCLEHGAELSHHHGGGLARSPYARRSLGSAHLVLRKIKSALDPAGILNPGKLGL